MSSLQRLTFSSLLISMSLILSRIEISAFFSAGGSVTLFSLAPLFIIPFKCGPKWGILSGASFGLLHLITTNLKFQGLKISSIAISILLDYIIAYAVIGLSSYFNMKIKSLKYSLVVSVIFCMCLKFTTHVLSGVIILYPLLKQTLYRTLIYSIIYNASYTTPETLVTLSGILIIRKLLPQLFEYNY